MIPADLLDELREKDPGCYHAYGTMLAAYSIVEGSPMSWAWLQRCLQEAILARGWSYAIGISSKGIASASVYVPGGDGETIMGYDEVDALIRAYLAAL